MQNFSIDSYKPDENKCLGCGLWGSVYDLGDETVIKIARDTSSGIGSGREKIQTEGKVLKSLFEHGFHLSPSFVDKGDIPENHQLFQQGFSLWLRMKKMKGKPIEASVLKNLPAGHVEEIGRSIGNALAELHGAFKRTSHVKMISPQNYYFAEIRPDIVEDITLTEIVNFLQQTVQAIPTDCFSQVTHGDFNISNILFLGQQVSAILDFAESGIGFPEKDIADVIKETPELRTYVIHAYEECSGQKINENYVTLGLAENALYGAVISAKRGDRDCVAACREQLMRYVKMLGYKPPSHSGSLKLTTLEL